jgi:hypothetical protein
MKPERFITVSQESITGPYPDPHKSNPHYTVASLKPYRQTQDSALRWVTVISINISSKFSAH